VLLGNGDGTFKPALTIGTSANPGFVAVGNLNADTVADLAVANYGTTPSRCSWATAMGLSRRRRPSMPEAVRGPWPWRLQS